MRPIASIEAIEPPPAPISIISMTGIEIGMPEPLKKRSRARDLERARGARLEILDQADLCGGAAHVVADDLLEAEALGDVGREIAPPAGPDSTSRTGNSAAVSTEIRPPPEWIRKIGQRAPIFGQARLQPRQIVRISGRT